ncbi:MAG: hypothetical protein JWP97_4356 [Labilithrix sp.]|nr:hypothetical protein [Labilithrix sp.]
MLVDDLDRCEVTKGAELLQALSLMLPAKQPIFLILALDRQKLAMGVAVRSKEVLPYMALSASGSADVADMAEDDRGAHARAGLAYGYEFIEKFIQLPFRVPMLTEAGLGPFLDSLLSPSPVVSGSGAAPSRSLLEEIVEHDSPEVRRVMKMAAPALGNNPRRLKQFLNLFRLRHYIAQKTGQLRVEGAVGLTLPQLGKIVAIELRWPLLLDRLLREPDALRAFVAKEDLPSLRPWATDREMITLRDHMPDSGAADYLLNSGLLVHLPTLYGTAANDSPAPAPIEMSAK